MSNAKFPPEQIVQMSDYEILKMKDVNARDVTKIKEKAARTLLQNGFKNGLQLKNLESEQDKITTGCQHIDKILKGGLDRKCITEIYGESGCGKTQIALQIAANAWETGAVYLCTEDVFPSKRLQQLFDHMNSNQTDSVNCGRKIFILQITEVDDLIKCVNIQLPRLLETYSSIGVIILDSIAAPFRGNYQEVGSFFNRAQQLKEIGIGLLKCAKLYNLAVLCINQVSSVPTHDFANSSAKIIPCLGLVWSNMVTTRIQLRKTDKYCTFNDSQIKISNSSNKILESEEESINSEKIFSLREFQVMFSPFIPREIVLEYVILSQGIKIITEN